MSINEDLILNWRFNEETITGATGEFEDNSENNRTGTKECNVTVVDPAKLNNGIQAGTDYSRVFSDDVTSDFTDFSFGGWINVTAKVNTGALMCYGDGGSDSRFNLWNDATGWKYWLRIGGGWHNITSSESSATTDGYVHVVCTFNYSSGLMTLYVNGVSRATANHTGTFDPVAQFCVGGTDRSAQSPSVSANAIFDDVFLYDKELTQSDIDDLYNGGDGQEITFDVTPPVITASDFINTTVGAYGLVNWVEPTEPDFDKVEAEYRVGAGAWLRFDTGGDWSSSGDYMPFNSAKLITDGYYPSTSTTILSGLSLGDMVTTRVRAEDINLNVSNWSVSSAKEVVNASVDYYFVDGMTVAITEDSLAINITD